MKSALQGRNASRQVMLGVLVIGMGMLFLVDNMGLFDLRHTLQFWPVLFIVLGILKLFDSRSADAYLLGGALVGVGVLMILHRLGLVMFNWKMVWPVMLIVLGSAVLYRAVAGRRGGLAGTLAAADDSIDVSAILGGFERRIAAPAFRGGEITVVMGGCALDMRGCSIDPLTGEALVNVFAVWGGVTMKVPPDWTVILQGTPIMGGFVDKTAAPPDASKRLVVRGYALMGGVEVRN